MRLKNGETITTVEFALEWRGADGKWRSEVFSHTTNRAARREQIEKQGATEITEHMRDRRTEHTPWRKTR